MQEQEFNEQLKTFWGKEAPDVESIMLFDWSNWLLIPWILTVADWIWFANLVEDQATDPIKLLLLAGVVLTVYSVIMTVGSVVELEFSNNFYYRLKDTSISGKRIVSALRKAQARKQQKQAIQKAVIQSLSESLRQAENNTLEKRIEALNAENAALLRQLNNRQNNARNLQQ